MKIVSFRAAAKGCFELPERSAAVSPGNGVVPPLALGRGRPLQLGLLQFRRQERDLQLQILDFGRCQVDNAPDTRVIVLADTQFPQDGRKRTSRRWVIAAH
jgi:hypothetical protein